MAAAYVVGRDDLFEREDGSNLGVERVEDGGGKWFWLRHVQSRTGLALLGLDENEDRHVMRMRFGPGANLLKTSGKGLTSAAIVYVLYVHHLEARLVHVAFWVKRWIRRESGSRDISRSGRMRVEPTLCIGVDIELDLAHAAVELLCEGLVLIVETFVSIGVLRLPELGFARCDAGVITVMGSDHLNLVDLQSGVVRSLAEAHHERDRRNDNCRPEELFSHQRLPLCW